MQQLGFKPETTFAIKSSMQLVAQRITSISMISYTSSKIHSDEMLQVQTLAEPVSQDNLLILSSVFLGPCVTRQWPRHSGSL